MTGVPAGWKPGKPLSCDLHGLLPGRPLTVPDAQVTWWSHLRDLHDDEAAGKHAARLRRTGRAVSSMGAR